MQNSLPMKIKKPHPDRGRDFIDEQRIAPDSIDDISVRIFYELLEWIDMNVKRMPLSGPGQVPLFRGVKPGNSVDTVWIIGTLIDREAFLGNRFGATMRRCEAFHFRRGSRHR